MKNIEKHSSFPHIVVLHLVIFGLLLPFHSAAIAQRTWSTPQWIPGLVDSTLSQAPVFLVDDSGQVHVFHTQQVGDTVSILHSYWIMGVGWVEPVDVLVSQYGSARVMDAYIDDEGKVNLIFWGGDDTSSEIFFSQAPIQQAHNARSWSNQVLIGPNAIVPATAKMVSDGRGYIVVVYSSNISGNGLYSTFSRDGGDRWSVPEPLYFSGDEMTWPYGLSMDQSETDDIYAVWSLGNMTGNGISLYFSAATGDDQKWSQPIELAKKIGSTIENPSIIQYNDVIFVIYHNDFPLTRWMLRSYDHGKTWTEPSRLFQHVGSNGPASLVVDNNNNLHMLFGNRVGNPIIHGLWHSVWQNDYWSEPEAVISGPQVPMGENGEEGFDPTYAQAVIINGNMLFVAWRHDPTVAGPMHIWYSYRYLHTQEVVPTAFNRSKPVIKPQVTTISSDIDMTPNPYAFESINVSQENRSPLLSLIISLAPAILLCIVFLIVFKGKNQ